MKVYKGTSSKELTETGTKVGEVHVTRSEQFYDDQKYVVWHQRIAGIYTPRGEFTKLKDAIQFGLSIENPTMIHDGYTFVKLHDSSSICIYYNQHENEIDQLISETEQASEQAYKLGDTGISACLVVQKKSRAENETYGLHADLLDEFGRYLKSDVRKERFKAGPTNHLSLEERLADVHHADIENFLYDRNNGVKY